MYYLKVQTKCVICNDYDEWRITWNFLVVMYLIMNCVKLISYSILIVFFSHGLMSNTRLTVRYPQFSSVNFILTRMFSHLPDAHPGSLSDYLWEWTRHLSTWFDIMFNELIEQINAFNGRRTKWPAPVCGKRLLLNQCWHRKTCYS